ncbi:hypothetical protein K438DRAFT_2091829 [Mycena galopus ATCC 62051]|nr:hypothetical protein K438DRAFT_2091829 [Mycena galopus ATCC 62051]
MLAVTPAAPSPPLASDEQRAWDIVLSFATTDMTLPQAESAIRSVLGTGFALNAVMDAENDSVGAELAVRALLPDFGSTSLPSRIARDPHLREAEQNFAETLKKMRKERCLRGDEPTLDDLLDPVLEREDLDSQFLRFSDGKEGVTEILEHMKAGQEDDEAEDEEPEEPEQEDVFSKKEALVAAEYLEKVLRARPDFEMSMPLGSQLRQFRAAMKQEMEVTKVQTTIGSFFGNNLKAK